LIINSSTSTLISLVNYLDSYKEYIILLEINNFLTEANMGLKKEQNKKEATTNVFFALNKL